jgi:hypothetical protein
MLGSLVPRWLLAARGVNTQLAVGLFRVRSLHESAAFVEQRVRAPVGCRLRERPSRSRIAARELRPELEERRAPREEDLRHGRQPRPKLEPNGGSASKARTKDPRRGGGILTNEALCRIRTDDLFLTMEALYRLS